MGSRWGKYHSDVCLMKAATIMKESLRNLASLGSYLIILILLWMDFA